MDQRSKRWSMSLLALALVLALLSGTLPAALAAAEDYGDSAWTSLDGVSIVRAGGTEETLARGVPTGVDRQRKVEQEKGAALAYASLGSGDGVQLTIQVDAPGADACRPFYSFNSPGGRIGVRVGALPGGSACLVVRNDDTYYDVIYVPDLHTGDSVFFDTVKGVRYSVRLAWGAEAGLAQMALLGNISVGDRPYDCGVDWTAVDSSMCSPEKDHHAYAQNESLTSSAKMGTVIYGGWADGVPQDMGPASVERLLLCEWQAGDKPAVVRADFSQTTDGEKAPVSLLVYDANTGRVSDYITLKEEETASFLVAPGGSYRFFLTHQGTSSSVRSERIILDVQPAEAEATSVWAKAEVDRAVEQGLVPASLQGDWQQPITRGEFAQMALQFLAAQHSYPAGADQDGVAAFLNAYCFSHTDRDGQPFQAPADGTYWDGFGGTAGPFDDVPDREERAYASAAYALGLINGKGARTFDPDGSITRQEAAALLARSYQLLDGAEYRVELDGMFRDSAAIAGWARDGVSAAVALGAMQGAEDAFDPLGTYTREQAAVTFLRLSDRAAS